MKILLISAICLVTSINANSQEIPRLSDVIQQLSDRWKSDSNSCKGYRQLLVRDISRSRIDSISKENLFLNLGKPNEIQRFSIGVGVKRGNYVGYVYFVYKDECPKIRVEGYAIQFVFDESETHLIKIADIDYCG